MPALTYRERAVGRLRWKTKAQIIANYTTLRDFVARCLRKNKHLSADSLFRTGEEVPLPDLPLKLKDLDSVIDSIFADRFLRLIQDLADYGRRGIYEFEAEEKGPVYEQEERWLNGDLSDLGISPLRGKRSSRPETRMVASPSAPVWPVW